MALLPAHHFNMDTDVDQLSHHHMLHPGGGPSFGLHRAYHPQHSFLIICSNSPPVPDGGLERRAVARAPVDDMLGTQSSMGSTYREKLHAVIVFLITTFGVLFQVEYQFKKKSPFDDHAPIMATILVNLCLYAVSFIAEYALPTEQPYLAIIKTFGPLLGFLAIVLLLFILVPLLGIIASFIWALFLFKASIMWFSRIVQCLRQVISGRIRYFDDDSEPSHSMEIV